MSVSFIGIASAATTSVTLPAHNVGDLIAIFAYRSTTTAPTLPAGYTNISNQSANGNSFRVGYKFATGSDTSGTWTNATFIIAVIYRGVAKVGGASSSTNAASTSDAITGIASMQITDGTSWAISYSGSLQTTSMSTPSGTTLRGTPQTATGCMGFVVDSNTGVSSWAQHTSTLGTSAASGGGSFELIAINGAASTLTNTFTANTTGFTITNSAGTTAAQANSELEITTTTTTGYATVGSTRNYDLTGSYYFVQLASAGNQSLASLEVELEVFATSTTSGNEYFWYVNSGIIAVYKVVGGSQTQLTNTTYNSTAHQWLRILESGGTTFFDYSSDGVTWNNFTSLANAFSILNTIGQLTAGTFAAEASGTVVKYKNFNVAGSPPPTTISYITYRPPFLS